MVPVMRCLGRGVLGVGLEGNRIGVREDPFRDGRRQARNVR